MDANNSTANLSYTFDSMGRLNTMTDNIAMETLITGASYGPANELLSITANGYFGAWGGESRSYNSLKQLTQLGSNGLSIQYNYPSTGNNGKIASQADLVSGEQVSYTYDALNRLATAATQSTFTPQWAQSYSYGGFGNLTNVTQDGTTILTASYDANNHAGGEDANGNPGYISLPADGGSSYAATYDVENRLVATGSSTIFYAYAPGNKRVWRGTWTGGAGNWTRGTDEITFWSVSGQKLAAYALTTVSGTGSPQFYATQTETNYYFGGKLIKNANGWVYSDRLASVGKFYPYGIERPSATTNGTEKFTGYFRDSETGNDYADQRYMSPGVGRFLTPDPYHANNGAPGDPSDPGSWNKYAYVEGDPVNFTDPEGELMCAAACPEDPSDPVPDGSWQAPGQPVLRYRYGLTNSPIFSQVPIGGGADPFPVAATPFPKCNVTGNPVLTTDLNFIVANYAAAAQVGAANAVPADWILAWAAQESGTQNPALGWGTISQAQNQNNFFGETSGAWNNTVACPSTAAAGYACFGSFTSSASAAFTSFNGRYGNVLTSAFAAGETAAQAFQAVAAAGWNPSSGYGTAIQSVLNTVDGMVSCLQNYYNLQ